MNILPPGLSKGCMGFLWVLAQFGPVWSFAYK
jgi:hypothetical protein